MVAGDYRQSHMTAVAAHQYEILYAPGTYDDWIWELERAHLAELIRRHVASRLAGIRLLDFACGTGRILAFLEPMTAEATGVDVSAPMLALARERVTKARLVCADITRDPVLSDGAYSLITAFRFFLNADSGLREDAMRAIRRALADDGVFIANIHGNLWSLHLVTYLVRRFLLRQEISAVSLWAMRSLLERHGFCIVEVVGSGWCTRRVYRLLGRRWCNWIERILGSFPVLSCGAVNLIIVSEKSSPLLR